MKISTVLAVLVFAALLLTGCDTTNNVEHNVDTSIVYAVENCNTAADELYHSGYDPATGTRLSDSKPANSYKQAKFFVFSSDTTRDTPAAYIGWFSFDHNYQIGYVDFKSGEFGSFGDLTSDIPMLDTTSDVRELDSWYSLRVFSSDRVRRVRRSRYLAAIQIL
jgi:hypothetical protein